MYIYVRAIKASWGHIDGCLELYLGHTGGGGGSSKSWPLLSATTIRGQVLVSKGSLNSSI